MLSVMSWLLAGLGECMLVAYSCRCSVGGGVGNPAEQVQGCSSHLALPLSVWDEPNVGGI